MVQYRRNRVAGGTYFFTVTLRDRRGNALVRHIDVLRMAWRLARVRVPHEVEAVVMLPEHLHAVIRMAEGSADYSRLWQEIKKGFTRRLPPQAGATPSPWQPRFWEHTLRRTRPTGACGLWAHQPRQTRPGQPGFRLAAFVLPPLRPRWAPSLRLGRHPVTRVRAKPAPGVRTAAAQPLHWRKARLRTSGAWAGAPGGAVALPGCAALARATLFDDY